MAHNILEISLDSYLIHHWKRTALVRHSVGITDVEWKLLWTKNYYREKCEALEKELTKVKARLVTVLKEKLDEM
jgi:hypothetical protein